MARDRCIVAKLATSARGFRLISGARITGVAASADYFERAEFEGAAAYYAEHGEAVARWLGRGSEAMGLVGSPAEGDMTALLQRRHPLTGEAFASGYGRPVSVRAIDFTTSAPKSTSVVAAIACGPLAAGVRAAHDDAVREVWALAEAEFCNVRRGENGHTLHRGVGFVGATYRHELSRSGDPQIHSHVVIVNAVVSTVDGRLTALDARPLFAALGGLDAVYRAELRANETALGLRHERDREGGIRIAGVSRAVEIEFSRRMVEIEEVAELAGAVSWSARDLVRRQTRPAKSLPDRGETQDRNRARAAEFGLGEREVAALQQVGVVPVRDKALAWTHVASPVTGVTVESGSFTRWQLIEAIADTHLDGARRDELLTEAREWIEMHGVEIAEGLWTTRAHLEMEARTLASVFAPRQDVMAFPGAIEHAIAARPTLGVDQADAVRSLTGDVGPVHVLEASAGSGKTFALAAVREAFERSGVKVLAVAPSANAAGLLARDAGFEEHATVSAITFAAEQGWQRVPDRGVVVVDEASMLGTWEFDRIAWAARLKGARLVLVGDRAQLGAVPAGGGFQAVAERVQSVSTLDENRRQVSELDRRFVALMRAGEHASALALLEEHDRICIAESGEVGCAIAAARWAEVGGLDDPQSVLLIAHQRAQVAALNDHARALMRATGRLEGEEFETSAGLWWSAGDRVIARKNDRPLGVVNGDRGRVIGVDLEHKSLRVLLDSTGAEVRLAGPYVDEHVEHGYASTVHTAQGSTADRAVLVASPGAAGKEFAYVAGSRHRYALDAVLVAPQGESGDGYRDRIITEVAAGWEASTAKTFVLDQVPEHTLKANEIDTEAAPQRRAEATAQRPDPDGRPEVPRVLRPLGTRDPWHQAQEEREQEPDTRDDLIASADTLRGQVDVGSPSYRATQRLAEALDERARTMSQDDTTQSLDAPPNGATPTRGVERDGTRERDVMDQKGRDASAELIARNEARKASRSVGTGRAYGRDRGGEAER